MDEFSVILSSYIIFFSVAICEIPVSKRIRKLRKISEKKAEIISNAIVQPFDMAPAQRIYDARKRSQRRGKVTAAFYQGRITETRNMNL